MIRYLLYSSLKIANKKLTLLLKVSNTYFF